MDVTDGRGIVEELHFLLGGALLLLHVYIGLDREVASHLQGLAGSIKDCAAWWNQLTFAGQEGKKRIFAQMISFFLNCTALEGGGCLEGMESGVFLAAALL